MHDIYNQLLSYLVAIWRRRWYGLGVAWLISLAGWGYVATLPDQYESSARVYVDTDSLLGPLMKGLAVEGNIYRQIDIIQRTLLSRPNLEKVARMTDLDLTVDTPTQMEALLGGLEKGIRIRSQGRNLFKVTYEHSDPNMAKRVVQSLLTIFVESNLGASRKDLTSARRFIDDQIRSYERQLEEAENRRAAFKRENMGFLPGEGGYYARMQATQARLEADRAALAEAVSRRDALTKQLASIPQFLETSDFTPEMDGGPGGPETNLQLRIIELEQTIDNLLLRYTPRHPDVVAAQRLKEKLEKKLAEQEEARSAALDENGPGAEDPAASTVTRSVPNPLYEQVKLRLVETEAEMAMLKRRIAKATEETAKWQSLAETVPAVEAELARLNRDYAVIRKNYEQLIARREAARLAEDLETKADKVQFRIVDPPQVPLKPSGPDRPLFLSMVLVAAIGGGIAFAYALSQIDDSITNLWRLRESFALPVLGSVSAMMSAAQRRRQALELSSFAMIVIGLLTAYGGLLAVEFLSLMHTS